MPPTVIDLATLGAAQGFVIEGDQAGCSVASAGDVNGGGLADLTVGAFFGDVGTDAGEAGVICGTDPFAPVVGGDLRITVAEGGGVTLTTTDLGGVDAVRRARR